MDLVPQQLLAGKYRLIRRLGEGGMGCVWVAEQLHLDRQVAIKVIGNRVLSEPSARDRFEIEARATARVESPHVVQVLDFDYTDEGQPFLVLELLVGETVEQRISREGPLSLADARELLKQATHALAEAHAADIFHRDIKAENLFLVARDELFVKLLDFGIALSRERASLPGLAQDPIESSPIGTPLYMSPEQTMAMGSIDERSDLYSLGVSMYYALTGQFPFNADTLAVLAFAQQREDFKMPSRIRPELGTGIDAFFMRALAFHPEDRFQTAEKLFEAFDRGCERALNADGVTMGEFASSSPSMRAAAETLMGGRGNRSLRSKKSSIALIAFAAAGAGFFLAPRFMQTSVSQSLSKAAVWSASRIPSAKVAAAEEGGDDEPLAPARSLEVSGATVTLPLGAAASQPVIATAPTPPAAPTATATATARAPAHHKPADAPTPEPDAGAPQPTASAAPQPSDSAAPQPSDSATPPADPSAMPVTTASAPAPQPSDIAPPPPPAPTGFDTRY
ncbi:MAG: protein kinase domain-containing protein [Polyangiaceae bacterium]